MDCRGSGYTYTHDLGIQAMQQNLGLSDEQIDRKLWMENYYCPMQERFTFTTTRA